MTFQFNNCSPDFIILWNISNWFIFDCEQQCFGTLKIFDQLKIFTYQLQIVFFTAFMGFTILDLKLLSEGKYPTWQPLRCNFQHFKIMFFPWNHLFLEKKVFWWSLHKCLLYLRTLIIAWLFRIQNNDLVSFLEFKILFIEVPLIMKSITCYIQC